MNTSIAFGLGCVSLRGWNLGLDLPLICRGKEKNRSRQVHMIQTSNFPLIFPSHFTNMNINATFMKRRIIHIVNRNV